ncbi:hypothetical protein [Acaryochloris marina]|uniref:Uncharacterized protein n=1 Tax=Acaryochloris marina (strain MBIC 11017) TaxID=329726 RepID=B0C7Q8_ACAM1|nr:hypothetical protein [Acaryochloris marina]ABW25318.1 hypothetical protein AM1_0232 [Acaryochloris marina MBIC11017]
MQKISLGLGVGDACLLVDLDPWKVQSLLDEGQAVFESRGLETTGVISITKSEIKTPTEGLYLDYQKARIALKEKALTSIVKSKNIFQCHKGKLMLELFFGGEFNSSSIKESEIQTTISVVMAYVMEQLGPSHKKALKAVLTSNKDILDIPKSEYRAIKRIAKKIRSDKQMTIDFAA